MRRYLAVPFVLTAVLLSGPQDEKAPDVGGQAPAVRLNDHDGKAARIGGPRKDGTWSILAFFPKASTPG